MKLMYEEAGFDWPAHWQGKYAGTVFDFGNYSIEIPDIKVYHLKRNTCDQCGQVGEVLQERYYAVDRLLVTDSYCKECFNSECYCRDLGDEPIGEENSCFKFPE